MKNIILLLTLWMAFPLSDIAQECNCKLSDELRQEQRINEKFKLTDALAKLKTQSSAACQTSYLEWMAEDLYSHWELDSAATLLEDAFRQYKKSNCKEADYYQYYKQLSILSFTRGEFPKSLEYSIKALSIAENTGDPYEEIFGLLQIAHTFNKMKESARGIEYYKRAAGLMNRIKAPFEKVSLLSKLATVYYWRYQDTKNEQILDSAKMFTAEQLLICRQHKYRKLLQKGYSMMNGYAHSIKDYPTALQYLDSSFYISVEAGDLGLQGTNYGDKADIMMEMGNYTEARRLADSCLILHQQVGNPENIANAYALLYEIGMRTKNYKDAVDAMNSYIEIQDSLTNAEKSKIINELEQKYNKAKNEKTIKELAQQKRIYILLAIAGLFALIGLAFFIRQQTLKNKQKILETEQRLNRARMNPHFFFNALSSLQSFAMEGNDGKSIASNLSKFSHIMRETLESTYKEYVTIEQETTFLNEYLSLQKIRFPQKFSSSIHISENIDPEYTLIPSMILQPFVENSIEHGFSGISYPGEIHLRFEKENNDLLIRISDNGKGLLVSGKENSEHISRASQIIRDRIYLLNIKLKTKASFSIDNHPSGKGVEVLIRLPYLDKDSPEGKSL